MIIFGYPGIGKTTLATSKEYRFSNILDLDSSFFTESDDPYWYKRYTRIAENFSRQNKAVFVSTHPQVLKSLKNSSEKRLIVCPSMFLKKEWVEKLDKRRQKTSLFKDKKAYLRVKEHFDDDIKALLEAGNWDGFGIYAIDNINYDLGNILSSFEGVILVPDFSVNGG